MAATVAGGRKRLHSRQAAPYRATPSLGAYAHAATGNTATGAVVERVRILCVSSTISHKTEKMPLV